jgi:EpsI family protein
VLDLLRVSDYVNRLYVAPGSVPIWLYVGYYETQRQGQIIHSPQHCVPGGGWTILSHAYMPVPLPGRGEPATINRVLIGKEGERQLVLYWYQERGRIIANEYAAKLYLITDAVTRNRTDGALVRISAPVVRSEDATLQQLLEFIRIAYPDLAASLPA